MLGFADIEDLDFLPRHEIAARLGYSSVSALRRALKRIGQGLPPCAFRGRARGDVVKVWAARLPPLPTGDGQAVPEAEEQTRPGAPPRPAAAIIDLQAARARIRARLERAG